MNMSSFAVISWRQSTKLCEVFGNSPIYGVRLCLTSVNVLENHLKLKKKQSQKKKQPLDFALATVYKCILHCTTFQKKKKKQIY